MVIINIFIIISCCCIFSDFLRLPRYDAFASCYKHNHYLLCIPCSFVARYDALSSKDAECQGRVKELRSEVEMAASLRARSSAPTPCQTQAPPPPCPPQRVCPAPPPCPAPASVISASSHSTPCVNVTEAYVSASRRFKPTGRFQILDWEAFNPRHVFSPHRIKGRVNRGGATGTETTEMIQFATKIAGGDGFTFTHGNMRVHPLLGTEYVVLPVICLYRCTLYPPPPHTHTHML
jgi:hypothetical protein